MSKPLVSKLSSTIERRLSSVIANASQLALVDRPDYPNVGDSAIWLGTMKLILRIRGRLPEYVCAWSDYDPADLAKAAPNATILISGGGNFGDLWPAHQTLREKICVDFPDNTIIQLPQSVYFSDADNMIRASRVFRNHRRLKLFARDPQSYSILRGIVGSSKVGIAPDMAFCLGDLEYARASPNKPLLALIRDDKESTGREELLAAISDPTCVCDWSSDNHRFFDYLNALMSPATAAEMSVQNAMVRVASGLSLLSAANRVVTDRLHGHILCLLLGLEHLFADNSYGKLSAFYNHWTKSARVAHFATCPADVAQWVLRARLKN